MIKRVLFILLCIGGIAFAIWKVAGNTIGDEVDKANIRLIEEYAQAVRYSTYNVDNITNEGDGVNYTNSGIASSVKCEVVNATDIGKIELHGCVIQGNPNRKYQYVDGKASRE